MRLFEHEAKDILRQHGILTPRRKVATTVEEAVEAAQKLKAPFVVKAQILASGRAKADGILSSSTPEEVEKAARKLFQSQIKGLKVNKILVEEKVQVTKELFFAMTIDRIERSYVAIASSKGGIDIELSAADTPSSVAKIVIDPVNGLSLSSSQELAKRLGFKGKQQAELAAILRRLCQIGMEEDAVLLEINPLSETPEGAFVALDSRLIVDDNALYRHPELKKLRFENSREHPGQEIEAMKHDIAYVKLDGEIGVIGNGAGLVMATLDIVQQYGGRPANFLDLGGGAQTERIAAAVKLVTRDPDVKVVLINILGGLTRCDDVARAIIFARGDARQTKPVIVRLVGTNDDEGRKILGQAGVQTLESMEEAAKQAVEAIRNESR